MPQILSTQDALYLAMLKNPDEDTVRLEYADYLEENGNPDRAEFIRVQCDREKSVLGYESADGKTSSVLEVREKQLLAAHPEWSRVVCVECEGSGVKSLVGFNPCPTCGGTGDLLRWFPTPYMGLPVVRPHQFRRGFVDEVSCTMDEVSCTMDECGAEQIVPGTPGAAVIIGGVIIGTAPLRLVPSRWAIAIVKSIPITRFNIPKREDDTIDLGRGLAALTRRYVWGINDDKS